MAVAGDMGDQDAEALFVNKKIIIEIACDSAHRNVARGNFEACKGGNTLRKNGGLNATSDIEFFADGEEPFFVGKDAIAGDVTETSNEHQKAEELPIIPRYKLQAPEIGLRDKQKPNHEACSKDPHFMVG